MSLDEQYDDIVTTLQMIDARIDRLTEYSKEMQQELCEFLTQHPEYIECE